MKRKKIKIGLKQKQKMHECVFDLTQINIWKINHSALIHLQWHKEDILP